ncbi:MAG TPA: YncE family protein, partial [Thermoplasmata archaeon]|nr:YncE family protein [Thermoplasmata archaeon]
MGRSLHTPATAPSSGHPDFRGIASPLGRPLLHTAGAVVSTIDLVANLSRPGADEPAIQDASAGAVYDPVNRELYVRSGDSGGLIVVDGVRNRVLSDLHVALTQNAYTFWPNIAVNSLTGDVYASNSFGDNVSIVNGSTNTVVGTVAVGGGPYAATFDPTDREVWVANYGSRNVTAFSTVTERVVANVPVGSEPNAILFDPASTQVFVCNFFSGNVTVIQTSSNKVVANLITGNYPATLGLDTHDDHVIVSNGNNGAQSHITVINASTDTTIRNVTVGAGPGALAYAPTQDQMFVANSASMNVSVVNLSTNTVVRSIPVGTGPQASLYDSVDHEVFVLNSETSNITIIDPATDAVQKTLGTAGGLSYNIQFDPVSGNVFAINQGTYSSPGLPPHAEANVTVVDGSTNSAIASIPIQVLPMGMLYDPASGRMLVNNPGGNDTYLIDPATRQTARIVGQGFWPKWSALDTYNGEIFTLNPGSYNVSVLDSSFHHIADVGTGYSPTAIAYDAANGDVYVTDNLGGNVSVINGTTHAVLKSIVVKPYDILDSILYDPHNGLLYVGDRTGDNVTVINGSTQTTGKSIPVGLYPSAFAYDSLNHTVFVANAGSGNASVINDTTNRVVANFAMYDAGSLAYDTASDVVYNAMSFSGDVQAFNAADYQPVSGYISLGSVSTYATAIAYDPDTQEVYVSVEYQGCISVISSAASYAVSFVETGLPASTHWSVAVNGTSNSSTTPTIGFTEYNGSFTFTIGTVPSYTPNVTTGGFRVDGQAVTVRIAFSHT